MFSAGTIEIQDGIFTQNNYMLSRNDLDKLKHVSSAGFNALNQDVCMEGTRVSLLNDLQRWSTDVMAHRIFWLDGMAGTGKSAVARSLCCFLHKKQLLGGCFFCLRGNGTRSDVGRILPTLAWSFACQDSHYRTSLLHTLRDDPDLADYPVERQFEFLVEKLLHVDGKDTQATRPPFVFVIDALDECSDAEAGARLLKKLLSASKNLSVKFFLTSRPECHIISQFKSPQSELHRILHLHDIGQEIVEEDISLYLTKRLEGVRSSSSYLPSSWPAQRDVKILSRRAGKLFIYAFTAIKYIEADDPVERLRTLTRPTDDDNQPFHWDLDRMYSLVLSAALDPKKRRKKEIGMTKRILGAIFAIRQPLYLSDIASLLGVLPHDVRVTVDRIRAVIDVPPFHKDGIVSTYHASFVDFLTTPGRAPENMRITLAAAHRDLADGCLRIMNFDSPFNTAVCLSNSKRTLAISSPLKYSRLHWAHHIAADDTTSFLAHLGKVLICKLLTWLDVLSVFGIVGFAWCISQLAEPMWLPESYVPFLRDLIVFVTVFREVTESIPHIYLSGLPHMRKTSTILCLFLRWQRLRLMVVFLVAYFLETLRVTVSGYRITLYAVSSFVTWMTGTFPYEVLIRFLLFYRPERGD